MTFFEMWAGCGTGEDDLDGGLIACRLTLMFPQFTQGVRHGSENFIIALCVCVSRLSEQIWTNTMKMRRRGGSRHINIKCGVKLDVI